MIYARADVPIYNLSVVCIAGCEFEDAKAELYVRHRVDLGGDDGYARGRCVCHEGDVYLWVKDLERGSDFIHEVTHAATAIMELRGIPLSYETDEVLAYLMGWLKINLLDVVYEEYKCETEAEGSE